MTKLIDLVFICASIILNVSVSLVYVVTKLGDMALTQIFGGVAVSMIVPFAVVLFYLVLELLLDYILQIPFREILAIHVPYIIVFYAALFSMMAVSYEKNKKMGYVVIATFCILIGCLIYNLLPT
jgi:hypothetical protein